MKNENSKSGEKSRWKTFEAHSKEELERIYVIDSREFDSSKYEGCKIKFPDELQSFYREIQEKYDGMRFTAGGILIPDNSGGKRGREEREKQYQLEREKFKKSYQRKTKNSA
ncbi:MAG: hypothetical protein RL189_2720 [Pseudomonadota bacterium]